MISYSFIQEMFKTVLGKSKAIQGRFHVCPKFGIELNTDTLGEILVDVFKGAVNTGPKYPLALMMPPSQSGDFDQPGWNRYRVTMFFFKQTGIDSLNKTQNPNSTTGTSMHTIPQDWQDMERVAKNFVKVLNEVLRKGRVKTVNVDRNPMNISPVSLISNDRASGVKLDFFLNISDGCLLEDYTQEDVDGLEISVADPHPEHKL